MEYVGIYVYVGLRVQVTCSLPIITVTVLVVR